MHEISDLEKISSILMCVCSTIVKLIFHTADDAPTAKQAQVPDQDVILALSDAVVYLHEQLLDVGIAAAVNVGLEDTGEGMADCRADEVAPWARAEKTRRNEKKRSV